MRAAREEALAIRRKLADRSRTHLPGLAATLLTSVCCAGENRSRTRKAYERYHPPRAPGTGSGRVSSGVALTLNNRQPQSAGEPQDGARAAY
jgi:hypothetical protein